MGLLNITESDVVETLCNMKAEKAEVQVESPLIFLNDKEKSVKKLKDRANHLLDEKNPINVTVATEVRKLLEHGMKVTERIFEKQLSKQVEIDEMQMGFIPGKDKIDANFSVN